MTRIEMAAALRRLTAIVTAGMVACVLASCAGTTDTARQYESYKVEADATLGSDDIVVVRADWEHEMGRVRATVRVRNAGGAVRIVHYRFGWLDESGRAVIDEVGAWRDIEVEPGQVVLLEGHTAHSGVTDFVLEVDAGR